MNSCNATWLSSSISPASAPSTAFNVSLSDTDNSANLLHQGVILDRFAV